jgi:hypothetical protein
MEVKEVCSHALTFSFTLGWVVRVSRSTKHKLIQKVEYTRQQQDVQFGTRQQQDVRWAIAAER